MIQVTRSSMPDFQEYCDEIRDLWNSRWLTNMGAKHDQLRGELESYLGVPHVTLFSNGHLALEGAIASMGFPEGAEIITTPFTFVSTTHAIWRNRLNPVFCDIRRSDYTMDPDRIEELITEKTCAILPVHVYGNLCDTDRIGAIAKKHGLKVIYDAAHAFGEIRDGKSAASFGDMSMFSFHATKVFHTIEGGAVCYADDALSQPLDDVKNFGIRGPEEIAGPGGNAKMNEFQAAMGICNLRHLKEEIAKRKTIADLYYKILSGCEGIFLCADQPGLARNYGYFPILLDGPYDRDDLHAYLAEKDVFTRKYFYPLTSSVDCYRNCGGAAETPVADYVSSHVLTLPLYADLAAEDAERICELIIKRR